MNSLTNPVLVENMTMSTNLTSEYFRPSQIEFEIRISTFLLVYGIFSFVGIVFNSFTIAVIVAGKKFGKNIRIQLLNISVVDLISSIILPSTSILGGFTTYSYPHNDALCKTQQYMSFTLFYLSLLLNATIGLEKFVAVYFPLSLLRYETKYVITTYAAVWILAFAVQIDVITSSGVSESPFVNNTWSCFPTKNLLSQAEEYKSLTLSYALKYLIPSFVILLVYSLIAVKLWRAKRIGEMSRSSTEVSRRSAGLSQRSGTSKDCERSGTSEISRRPGVISRRKPINQRVSQNI